MEASAFIQQEDGVETAKICRWCLSTCDALKPLSNDKSGQYKLQKLSECTGVQVKLLPGVPLYLCAMCNSRLEKTYLMQCNKNIALDNGFTENQNTANNGADISKDQLGHSAEQTVGTELLIKTEATTPDAAHDLHLNQRNSTVPQVSGTPEYCGNQPFEAEENPITFKLEYVDVDELCRLQTNAILDHEQDDLQTNPSELVCQDREDQSMSNNMCADGTEFTIKTEDTTPDEATDSHLKQKCSTVHEANMTYECCGKIPDDLFEAEENPIAIKSEDEEVEEQHQLQTTNGVLEEDNPKSHRKKRKHQCPHCSSVFVRPSNLKIHIRTHTGERPYVCKVCDKAFRSSQYLLEHSKIHNKDQQHQCPHCSSRFPWLSNLKIHIRTHTGERPYVCKVCDKAFRSPKYLLQHSKMHNKEQHHQCPNCSSSFPWLASLKVHIRTHTGERPYVCKVCDKAFRSSQYLLEHSKIHNKEQHHQCPHCSSRFPWLSNLKIHIRTHTGEKPYKCKICDEAFHSSTTLATHSKIHNKDQQHQCPYCSSMFSESSNLKVHIRTHTAEKPYQCKVCDKAFRSRGNLVHHSKMHNKDQQHQCPYCSSMFAESSNLKVHIRTHTGEKPYKCKLCDEAFHSSTTLATHSKIHNKDQHH